MIINYRKMEILDLDAVKVLDKLAFPNPWPENAFHYELETNTNARLWVTEIEDNSQKTIIAFAVIWIILDEAHIGTFAVHPDLHQKGIGQQFLAFISKQLNSDQISRIFLEVRKSNLRAINLYKKFKFEVDGERKHYYRDNGESAILMSSPLMDDDFYNELFQEFDTNNKLIRREFYR